MRFVILSAGRGWHTQDLVRAAEAGGHRAEVVSFRQLTARVGGDDGGGVRSGETAVDRADRVLVRMMPGGSLEQVVFRMDALAAVADAGVAVINPPKAIEVSVDKYLATRLLAQAGLAVPATIACEKADDALAAFEALGRDVVVKPLFGSEGRGLFRVNDADLAFRTFKTLEQLGAVAYVQQFIEHDGSDYRALVMGNSVVAATRRTSADGWRTNVARGGKAEAVELAAEQQATAVRAARACGCLVAGVDLLPGVDGRWWVLEVNAVPGWRAMAPATGLDIAAMMIDFAAEAAW